MINATYGEFAVLCNHNGQRRRLILHVVHTEQHGDKFFLFDTFGYAIDDPQTITDARTQYAIGTAEEINL